MYLPIIREVFHSPDPTLALCVSQTFTSLLRSNPALLIRLGCSWNPGFSIVQPGLLWGPSGGGHLPYAGTSYLLPAGYTSTLMGPEHQRSAMSPTPLTIPAKSWVTDNRLKLSASEIISRGTEAERRAKEQSETNGPRKPVEDAFKRLGLRGLPMFYGLSYFKCDPIDTPPFRVLRALFTRLSCLIAQSSL